MATTKNGVKKHRRNASASAGREVSRGYERQEAADKPYDITAPARKGGRTGEGMSSSRATIINIAIYRAVEHGIVKE
jgi:hypothetical protein